MIFDVVPTSSLDVCALQNTSRLILDLGDSGPNPCADTRGLAGAVSSSVAFNRWPVRSYPGGVGVTQANHLKVTTLAELKTTKTRESAGR